MSETYIHDNKIVATFSTVSSKKTLFIERMLSFARLVTDFEQIYFSDWRILAYIFAFQTPVSDAIRHIPALCKCTNLSSSDSLLSLSKESSRCGRTLPAQMEEDGLSVLPNRTRRSSGKI